MGILYLVSTPIGNLEDITLRAIRLLFEADVIACEDTRKTGLLLQHLKNLPKGRVSKPKLISYYEENELKRIPQIIKLLKKDKKVVLVSSAGTPTVSDPGFKLVRECVRQGIKIEPIPGASAVLTALVASGLPTDKFLFLGYLPKKKSKRKNLLSNLVSMKRFLRATIIIYPSPHRLIKELEDIQEILGDIQIVLCRELTKAYEEIRREKISEAINHFSRVKPKGELTLLFSQKNDGN